MGRFALRRLGRMLAVLIAVSLAVFLIFSAVPSDPATQIAGGKNATPALVAQVERTWGFDDPLPVQYLTTMKLAVTGELVSYTNQLNVAEEIWKGLPATLSLCIGAAALWMLLAVGIAYLSAFRAGGIADRVLTLFSFVSISVPVFFAAALTLNYLSYRNGLFPSGGYVGISEDPVDWAYHLVLPWTTLALIFTGVYARVLRANLLEAMEEDHVRTGRAMGLGEHRIRLRHVLRNALLPVVTLLALDFSALVGGAAIVTEYIFDLQGVGQLAADAASNSDLPPLMGVSLFAALFVVALNTAVDIAYTRLDPRLRLGRSGA